MTLRSSRERVIQSLAYEAGGLGLSVPLFAIFGGGTTGEAFWLMLALSAAVLIWSPFHNTVFDWLEFRLSGRLASDRPKRWRMVHAVSIETTIMLVTVPIMMGLGGLTFQGAILADLGLTLLYVAYAYVFHLVYDQLRPMRLPRAAALPMTDLIPGESRQGPCGADLWNDGDQTSGLLLKDAGALRGLRDPARNPEPVLCEARPPVLSQPEGRGRSQRLGAPLHDPGVL
jgi:uncharacterized membrane protein